MENSGGEAEKKVADLGFFRPERKPPEALQLAPDHEKSLAFMLMCAFSHTSTSY